MSIQALSWAFNQDLKPNVKFVLIALANRADEEGYCYPSYEWMQKATGYSRRAVIGHVKKLVAMGILSKERRRKTSNLYRIAIGAKSAPIGVQNLHPTGAKSAPNTKDYTIKEKKGFLDFVSEEYNGDPIAKEQAAACWDYWEANAKFPEGCYKAAFRGWLRKGKSLARPDRAPSQQKQREHKKAEPTYDEWNVYLARYKKNGLWPPSLGDKPEDEGCKAPEALLQGHGFKHKQEKEYA